MKSAKLGAIFLISVMALAGVGAGYAMWYQDLTIDVEINTGEFCVGVRDDGTGDPGPHYLQGGLLYPDGPFPAIRTLNPDIGTWDLNYGIDYNIEGKNIGRTESINDPCKLGVKCTKETKAGVVEYYHCIAEVVDNAYPWYESWICISFGNCGTIPAKINSGYWMAWEDPDNVLAFLAVDKVEIWVDGNYAGEVDTLEGFQYQLDPCHTVSFYIYFYFMEEYTDPAGQVHVMPQGATASLTYFIQWAQWNEVPGTPWTPLI